MSNTRHASHCAPLSEERYMSAVEFRDMRGIPGNAVAAKAMLVDDPRKRALLFFLQGRSIEAGAANIAKELLELFPERLGSPTMHAVGVKPASIERIRMELGMVDAWETLDSINWETFDINPHARSSPKVSVKENAATFMDRCRDLASENLAGFITEFCVNPDIPVLLPGEQPRYRELKRCAYYDSSAGQLTYFNDIHSTLLEYQKIYTQRMGKRFATTEVGNILEAILSKGRRRSKIFVVEGDSGIGKSATMKPLCEMQLGEARYVRLNGMCSATEFFRAVCKACGLSATYQRKQGEMRDRAADFLNQAKLTLVIDEAHHILPTGKRVYAQPEIMNWLYTMTDAGVSIVLLTTAQFIGRMRDIAEQIVWNLRQVERRLVRCKLPAKPSVADVWAVGKHVLTPSTDGAVKALVGFAGPLRNPLTVMSDVAQDAKEIAAAGGHQAVTAADVEEAIKAFEPSYQALREAFHGPIANASSRRRKTHAHGVLITPESVSQEPIRHNDLPEVAPSSSRFAGHLQET